MVKKLFELVALIISFFIPNIIIAPFMGSFNLLDTDWLLALFTGLAFLQLVFMYGLVKIMGNYSIEELGLSRSGLRDMTGIIGAAGGILGIYLLFSLVVSLLPAGIREQVGAGYQWKLNALYRIPLVVVFCIVTGYREEFLFRSYFLTTLKSFKSPWLLSVCITTILFALLHSYEGIGAMIFAAIAGLYFALVFIRTQNLHVIGLAHGIYNALILVLSAFVG
jgi:membrane protease YdiL (CAAX protease family)